MSECDRVILRLTRKLAELKKDSKTSHLTGEHFTSLSSVAKLTGLHVKTIKALEENGPSTDFKVVDRSIIYTALCRFYIRNRTDGGKVPTTYQLFDALVKQNKLPNIDIATFRKLLLKMGFIWKKIEGRAPVVIENPLIRFERYNYLMQIKKSRVERFDDIYFVGELAYNLGMIMDIDKSRDFERETGLWQVRRIHAVGRKSIICMKEINDFNSQVFEDWIENDLIPYLSVPSVIVVTNIPHHSVKLIETPTLLSSKTDMMKWLDHFDIPYDPDMSKYELFSLAEDLTDLDTHLYKVDEYLNSHGHTVLRMPTSIGDDLNPAHLLLLYIASKVNMSSDKTKVNIRFENVLKDAVDLLQRFSSSAMYNEQKMLIVEKDVDKQLDALLMQKNPVWPDGTEREDSDVVSCDSD